MNTKQRLKTAKGRSVSSTKWLQRNLNDQYTRSSKLVGYRSRSAFKLIEIDSKFKIFHHVKTVLDLGAAPGGWLQVARERCPNAEIIGVDLKEINPIADVHLIQGNFLELLEEEKFNSILTEAADIILSDMAANSCGERQVDHLRITQLVESALSFAVKRLNNGGHFVAKMLHGSEEKRILQEAQQHFSKVRYFKPNASYSDSSEIYIVAQGFIAGTT